MTDRFRLVFKTVLALAVLVMALGSLMPPSDVPAQPVNDKMLHFAAYALAGLLASLAFRQSADRVRCLLLLTVMGVTLEFCQTMVPGRAFEIGDMAANGCGSFAAFTAVRIIPTG